MGTNTKTIKVSEATGAVLDWMVREALTGHHDEFELAGKAECYDGDEWGQFSTDWAQGGPIIERENIELTINSDEWKALMAFQKKPCDMDGPTPLIAAMRCYVASKLGDTVEVPDELA